MIKIDAQLSVDYIMSLSYISEQKSKLSLLHWVSLVQARSGSPVEYGSYFSALSDSSVLL